MSYPYPDIQFFGPGYALIDGGVLNFLFGRVIPVQRSVILQSQIAIQPLDFVLNCNLSVATNFALPKALGRRGKPLMFVDAGLQAGANNITLTPHAGDTIVNWTTPSSLVMDANGQVVALNPFNDGVNNGWFVA